MYKLPDKLNGFTPYEPLTGDYPIRLDVNESFFELPTEEVVRAVMDISKVALNRYPDPYSSRAVEAFADLFGVNPANVVAGNGSDELIGLIAAGLLEKGGKVLTLTPDFSMYAFYARLYELQVAELPKDGESLEIDVDAVIAYINRESVDCLIFSNPCNPTSLGLARADVMRIVTETPALIVADEAYMDFWNESESVMSEAADLPNLIVLRTCSKSVALAGIRLGFAVANAAITSALRAVKSPFNVNSLTQAIGAAVLSDKVGYRKSINYLRASTVVLRDAFLAFRRLEVFDKVYDTKTNFVYARMPAGADELHEFLLGKGIAVRRFGDCLRVCAGKREDMNELARYISAWKVGDITGQIPEVPPR